MNAAQLFLVLIGILILLFSGAMLAEAVAALVRIIRKARRS